MQAVQKEKQYTRLMTDITHVCNARCRFCFNDWQAPGAAPFMKEEHQRQINTLVPMVELVYLFSCLYEPTIHPQFTEFLGLLPPASKETGMYTTNLVKPLSDAEIDAMATANIARVNISFETLDEEKHKYLAQVKQSAFFDNLPRIARAFAQKQNAPQLFFTTMMLKDNIDELADIAHAAQGYGAFSHEFRTPYFSHHYDDYIREQMLSKKKLSKLTAELSAVAPGIRVEAGMDKAQYMKRLGEFKGDEKPEFIQDFDARGGDIYLVRINSHGDCRVWADDTTINLSDMPDAKAWFTEKIVTLQTMEAPKYAIAGFSPAGLQPAGDLPAKAVLEEAALYNNRFLHLNGYSILAAAHTPASLLCVTRGGHTGYYNLRVSPRADLSAQIGSATVPATGFSTIIDVASFPGDGPFEAELLHVFDHQALARVPLEGAPVTL